MGFSILFYTTAVVILMFYGFRQLLFVFAAIGTCKIIGKPRNTPEYEHGLKQFPNFALMNAAVGNKIKCPCHLYYFQKWQTRDIVYAHLICKQFSQNYVTWVMHGESNVVNNSPNLEAIHDILPSSNPIELLINEAFQGLRHESININSSQVDGEEEMSNDMPASNNTDFLELLRDGSQKLCDGSKYSKLEFLLKLYHIKCLGGLSDKGMTMLLDLLRDAFDFVKLPSSFYDAKKTIKKLCLDYIKIDTCKHCHTSRWKPIKNSGKDHAPDTSKKIKKKSAKILRYFPLKSRLQRLFMCSKTAEHMRWYGEDVKNDGILRHSRKGKDMEERNPPKKLSESDILQQVKDIDVTFQKPVEMNDRRKRNRERSRGESSTQQWKKKIIFFQLSYWEFNPLPNNLDIMHIEKNVFDNVLYSMLNEIRKSKDHDKARKYLQDMGIRPDLWPDEKEESRLAAFAIPTKKRAIFLKTLKNISVPDGYSILEKIVLTLCHLEMLMLGHFKSFVRNKSQAEGSIAEGYMVEEALTFCSYYFEDIESRVNRPKRVNDESYQNKASNRSSMFPRQGKSIGAPSTFPLTVLEKSQAHQYVLLNCVAVQPFINEFKDHIRRSSRGRRPSTTEVEKRFNKEFADWFPKRIMNPNIADTISTDLQFLARGPSLSARRFSAYNISGFKFRTLSREQGLKTQNNGVFLTFDTSYISFNADRNARQEELPYYGKLEDIIKLNYYNPRDLFDMGINTADSNRAVKRRHLKVSHMLNLSCDEHVIVEFADVAPVGEAQGLLASFIGILAIDSSIFPIEFVKWSDLPVSYFNYCFDNLTSISFLKPRFFFQTTESIVRRYVYNSISRKWSARRLKLWDKTFDPLKSRSELMDNISSGISKEQWTSYVDYRLVKKIQKQTIPHSGGSKSNVRRRAKMMICKKIELVVSQSTVDESEVSPNDVAGKVPGKEHSGRVRCLGLGVVPSRSFKQVHPHFGGMSSSSSNSSCPSNCQENYTQMLKAHKQSQQNYKEMVNSHNLMMNTFKAYMIMKEGTIPEQFAGFFTSPMLSDTSSGPLSDVNERSYGDSYSSHNH
ncbi:hypothetical protein P3S68_022114 [Capsicum galapagoense]